MTFYQIIQQKVTKRPTFSGLHSFVLFEIPCPSFWLTTGGRIIFLKSDIPLWLCRMHAGLISRHDFNATVLHPVRLTDETNNDKCFVRKLLYHKVASIAYVDKLQCCSSKTVFKSLVIIKLVDMDGMSFDSKWSKRCGWHSAYSGTRWRWPSGTERETCGNWPNRSDMNLYNYEKLHTNSFKRSLGQKMRLPCGRLKRVQQTRTNTQRHIVHQALHVGWHKQKESQRIKLSLYRQRFIRNRLFVVHVYRSFVK